MVLPRHRQDFLLGLITKLALPEAHGELRHHGNPSRDGRIVFHNLGRRIPRRDPVIDLL